jgi:hypothetical protein
MKYLNIQIHETFFLFIQQIEDSQNRSLESGFLFTIFFHYIS